jgi:dipeptidyl-peptidase 4
MKKILLITVLFSNFLCTDKLGAQSKKFTMQEAVLGLGTALAPANLKQLKWMGNANNSFAQVIVKDSVEYVQQTVLPICKTKLLFSLPKLNEAIARFKLPKFKKIPALNWMTENYFTCTSGNTYIGCTAKNDMVNADTIYTLPADAENVTFHKPTMNVAYSVQNNLYIKLANGKTIQVTKDGNEGLVYGGGKVHQNEFGIDGAIFWSNNGKQVAFYKMDQSMVTDYPIIDWNAMPAKVSIMKYPFAGQKSHIVKLLNFNIETGKMAEMETREPADQYLTCVTWHPSDEYIYITLLNRAQNDASLNKYNANSGEFIKTIITEKHEKYVEPQHDLYFIPGLKNEMIWWSQKSGYMHLYSINEETGEEKQLTNGNWVVNEIVGYNAINKEIIYTSTQDGAMNKHIYAIDIQDKLIRKLNRNAGWHNATANADATYLIDDYSSTTEPKVIDILGVEGDYEKRLLTANNTLINYAIATVKPVTFTTKDGTKLNGRLMLPANFDSTKKYPTIVYLYNGPHVQLIKNTFPESGNLWYDYLTQNGYIVFTMDGRGSGNRGFEFESATHLKLGSIEMEDQMKGIEYLQKLPYINKEKMGMHGWSFGGFMTTSFMLRQPNVFKVGVAGGPVMDWSKYEIMYTERYMGTPISNAKGYDDNNLLTKTNQLKGKLLLIHGTDDDVVVWQHSLAFLKKCVDNNQQVDYFVYPGYQHNVRGKDRVHLMQKITDYFDLYLK